MNKNKIDRLQAIKEEVATVQARLVAARKLEEAAQPTGMATLLENDLDQAELILAAQDMMHKLQNMAEDLAKMNAQDLFPLVDKMKATFGQDGAHQFEESAQGVITAAMNSVRSAKDEMGNAIMRLEGKLPANDMAADVGAEPAAEPFAEPAGDDMGGEADIDGAMDDFGAADAAAGPVEEPLGRAKKESVEGGKALNESIILEAAGQKLIETEGLDALIDWVLNEAALGMPEDHFKSFASSVAKKAAQDPVKLAGWIGKKKHGMAAMAQLAEPTFTQSADLDLVEGKTFKKNDDEDSDKEDRFKARKSARKEKGKGEDELEEGKTFRKGDDEDEDKADRFAARKSARKEKQKGDDELEEGKTFRHSDDEDSDKEEKFKARKSARREKQKGDDAVSEGALVARTLAGLIEGNLKKFGKGMASKTVTEFANKMASAGGLMEGAENCHTWVVESFMAEYGMSPASYSVSKLREFNALSSQDKKVAAGVMGKVAANMSKDKSAANKGISTAMQGLDGQERSVAQKMINNMKKDGQNPKNVGDFATNGSAMVDDETNESLEENINAAHWPVDTMGQYKGEPFSTDYQKLKSNPAGSAKTEGGEKAAEPKAEEVKGSSAPEGGKPWEKKEEPKAEEPKEEKVEESEDLEEGLKDKLKKAALGMGAAAAMAGASAGAATRINPTPSHKVSINPTGSEKVRIDPKGSEKVSINPTASKKVSINPTPSKKVSINPKLNK
jgi:hypothetical protein